jgi:hypothetical protein
MKNTTKILILTLTLAFSSLLIHTARAQEFAPLAKLAQDYLMRMNTEEGRTVAPDNVVNPEQFEKAAVTESIETVNKTIEEVRIEKQKVVEEIQETVKRDIDNSIVNIRKTTEKPAYELQRAIDQERTQLFENVTRTVEAVEPSEVPRVQQLQAEVSASLDRIKTNLEKEAGIPVDFQRSHRDVRTTLLRFEQVLAEKERVIDSRAGDLVFEDSDQDGLSDYDETYIYKTDPKNAKTKGTGRNDGEKVRDGINPLSDSEEKMAYQDPREDKESYVSSTYKVNKVQLIKENERSELVFEGVALPNSYITLYIYSTPIIVTVKTDSSGAWTYELEQELEDGEHQMYVATVDNSGKILARSNPILFTKSAEAATIGIAGSLEQSVGAQTFLKDNFILITLAVLIAVVILTMMFVGNHKDIRSAVVDLRNEVNQK